MLPQTDDSVNLGASCVAGAVLERSVQACSDPGALWTEVTCVMNDDGKCQHFSEPEAVVAELSPCEHADRLIFEPVACFDNGCVLPLSVAEIVDFEFGHYLGRPSITCLPKCPSNICQCSDICKCTCLCACECICLYMLIHMLIHITIHMSIHLSLHMSTHKSAHISIHRRAIECMPALDKVASDAGRVTVAVVSGTVVAGVAANVGGAMSASLGATAAAGGAAGTGTAAGTSAAASTSSSGMGAMGILGVVQFAAVTSNMCIVQGVSKFGGYFSAIGNFDIFNFRIRLPKFMLKWPVFESLAVCGMPPVDLVSQARADIGDVFCGNIFFGFCMVHPNRSINGFTQCFIDFSVECCSILCSILCSISYSVKRSIQYSVKCAIGDVFVLHNTSFGFYILICCRS